jgi:lysozyme
MNSKQRLTAAGLTLALTLIVPFEGLRQKVFLDPVGIPTACFGHTDGVDLGQSYTKAECEKMLMDDVLRANQSINQCVKVPLTAYQRSAFASFTYNVGGANFCRSTLVRKLNAGDYTGACNELPKWTYAKGFKLPGLARRRAAERAMCLGATA